MLERALSKTFTELATVFLVACVFTAPIYFVHAFLFRNVYEVAELAPDIRRFPEGRQVRGVGAEHLERERNTLLIVSAAALTLLVFVARAAGRAHEVTESGGVATVSDSLRHATHKRGPWRLQPGHLVVGAIGVLVAFLVLQIGTTVTDLGADKAAWLSTALTRTLAMALFLAILGGSLGVAGKGSRSSSSAAEVDLY